MKVFTYGSSTALGAFMSENTFIWIISGLVSLVNFLFWSRIKRIEKDVDETKKKSSSIEKNYLTRFEDLHNKLSEVEKNIIREIYTIKLSAISNQHLDKEGG